MNDHWNPRFTAYANQRGLTPQAAWEADCRAWPFDHNRGYREWILGKWAEWRGLRGVANGHGLSEADQADFDAWLDGAL